MLRSILSVLALVMGLTLFAASPAQAIEVPVGQVANSLTSSASVRAYDNRVSSSRIAVGLCGGSYKNVSPGYNSGFGWDADCIRMYSGSTKVTGIVKVKSRISGNILYTINVGCTSNRYDIGIHGTETGIVSYARKCA